MLNVLTRQKYLKRLGFYTGVLDGREGPLTVKAYKAFQKKYGLVVDGIYGAKTDAKLKSVYKKTMTIDWDKSAYFKKSEFKCNCGGRYCDGYPSSIDPQLLANLNKLRKHFGKPVVITSGLRCKKYNASMSGSSSTSLHMEGQAVDIYIAGLTTTLSGRKKVMAYWKKLPKYNYTYCDVDGSHPNMGNAVHVDIDF